MSLTPFIQKQLALDLHYPFVYLYSKSKKGNEKKMKNRTDNFKWMTLIAVASLIVIHSCKTDTKVAPETEKKGTLDRQTLIIDSLKMDDLLMVPKIHFPAEYTKILNTVVKEGDPFYCEINNNDKLLIETRLDTTNNQIYNIYFSYGMSLDPFFAVFSGNKPVVYITGLELTVEGNGKIYSSGHTNTFFNERRLWNVVGDTITEQRQPFLYSGLKTVALTDFPVYTDTLLQFEVKTIRAEDSLEVLINQGEFYLLKDKNNIVGWWKLDNYMRSNQVKDVYYLGD